MSPSSGVLGGGAGLEGGSCSANVSGERCDCGWGGDVAGQRLKQPSRPSRGYAACLAPAGHPRAEPQTGGSGSPSWIETSYGPGCRASLRRTGAPSIPESRCWVVTRDHQARRSGHYPPCVTAKATWRSPMTANAARENRIWRSSVSVQPSCAATFAVSCPRIRFDGHAWPRTWLGSQRGSSAPPSRHGSRTSHLDCRRGLILIVALQREARPGAWRQAFPSELPVLYAATSAWLSRITCTGRQATTSHSSGVSICAQEICHW